MEIVIKIPESFEGHFNQDRFKDSLERILEDCKHSAILSGIYEFETIEMLIRAFENGTPLPKVHGRKFEEIVVEYPPAELCTYPEYRGKPYFSIKYEENGEHIIGFGTYNPEVLSRYLQEYFITPTIIETDGGEEDGNSN